MSAAPLMPSSPAPDTGPTEEEVKINVVVPWLRRLGVNPDEMSFEQSFTLRLGHNQVVVGRDRKLKDRVGGRYDTLIKRNGWNLLIVEFKAGGLELETADRDQAVSYARLLDQVAPYALVTNGKDYKIFDVLTKAEVNKIEIRDGYHLTLPEDLLVEAQELFLNLSLENLLVFCGQQVAAHHKTLMGSPANLAKKYVPDLTVPRMVLDPWVAALEAGAEAGLLVFAESGRGKTSALCDLARRRVAGGRPTLFFSGSELEGGLLGAIANEFNWVFSEQVSSIHLVKRLARMTAQAPLVIILDAVDEWLYAQRAVSLLAFLRGIQNLGIKVLLSCKTNAWQEFTSPGGRVVGIDTYLLGDGKGNADCGRHLPDLTDGEFHDAVQRYRNVFGVRGRYESSALAEARRNPFLLRVLFSVAVSSGAKDISFSLKDFFGRYYQLILERTGRAEVADAQLVKLAAGCDARNRASFTLDEVREVLALPVTESLLPALFEQDVLQKTPAGIGFYFQHLRDYLIAFRVRKWHQLSPDEFARTRVQGVALEAFNFYLRYASTEQMRALTGPAYVNAEKYVALYDELLGKYFPNLREEFEPRAPGAVGFIAEYVVTRRCIGGYGFRVREAGEPAVLLVPVDEFFSKSNLLAIHGASALYHCSSADGFMATNVPAEVVEHEILRQMLKILKEQRLRMRTASTVPREALVAAVEGSPRYFAYLYDQDVRHVQYPLNAAKLRKSFERVNLANHFRSDIAAEKLAVLAKSSGGRGRSVTLTQDDEVEILRRMEGALASGRPVRYRSIVTNVRDLEESLTRLGAFDLTGEVTGPVWPSDYYFSELLRSQSEEGQRQLEKFVGDFIRAFLTDYRAVVEENFPSLKSAFSLYSDLPVRLYIEVDPRLEYHQITGWLAMIGERLPAGSPDEVIVCSGGELDRSAKTYRGRPIEAFMESTQSLSNAIPWKRGGQVLHDYIYRQLLQEWPKVANVIRKDRGLPPKGSSF